MTLLYAARRSCALAVLCIPSVGLAQIVPILGSDPISESRVVINNNFAYLDTVKVETASNTGSLGVGLFKLKSAKDLQIYKLASANSLLDISLVSTDYLRFTMTPTPSFTSLTLSGNLTRTAMPDGCANWASGVLGSSGTACGGGSGGEANITADVGTGLSLRGTTAKSGVALNLRTLAATSPLTVTTAADLVTFNMPAATTSVSGHLTSADWTTFNSKYGSGASPSFVNLTLSGTLTRTGQANGCASWASGVLTSTGTACGGGTGPAGSSAGKDFTSSQYWVFPFSEHGIASCDAVVQTTITSDVSIPVRSRCAAAIETIDGQTLAQYDRLVSWNSVQTGHMTITTGGAVTASGGALLAANNLTDLASAPAALANIGAAPSAQGVTNGNMHDHNGGDGGQIAHTSLSAIGTNTHAQIDTAVTASTSHIANVANPHATTAAQIGSSIPALTTDAAPDATADYVITYDNSASAPKKVLLQNLPAGSGASTSVSNTFTRGQIIDGTTDENQLRVQGNATQTNPIFVVEKSDGTDILVVNNDGSVSLGTGSGPEVITAQAAPATPAAGTASRWIDSTDKVEKVKDDTGAVSVSVRPDAGAANQYLTGITAAGVITKAQLSAVSKTRTCTFNLGDPVIGDTGKFKCQVPVASILTNITCHTDTGSVATVNIDKRASATPLTTGTSAMGTALTCSTTPATGTVTSTAVTARDWLTLTVGAATGTPTVLTVAVEYTIN